MYPYKVSVLVVSYNHVKYLEEAIESILAQQVDFPMEIVFADDCSTDGTQAIIQKYQSCHSEIVRVLDTPANLGITRNYQRGFAACAGEYIAVMEGDDYWLGKDRLKCLVEFLEAHPECVLVFNRMLFMDDAARACRPLQWSSAQPYELLSGYELAGSNFIGNFSGCVYRASVIGKVDAQLYDHKMYDWLFNMFVSRFGLIGFIPRILSVYRQHGGGTWSSMTVEQKLEDTMNLIPLYNTLLDGVYAEQLTAHQNQLRAQLDAIRIGRQQSKNAFSRLYWLAYRVLRKIKRKTWSLLGW